MASDVKWTVANNKRRKTGEHVTLGENAKQNSMSIENASTFSLQEKHWSCRQMGGKTVHYCN